MSPYVDKEKQKAYMREYQRKNRELLKKLTTIKCKICGETKQGIANQSPEKDVCMNCYFEKAKT